MTDLAHTLLSEEILRLVRERRSGILAVSSQDVTKGIFLRGGCIVFASSTLEKDKLGEHLIRLGRISRADFAAAFRATRDHRRRIGQALTERGLLAEEELGRLVSLQVQKIVVSLFTWTRGSAHFQEVADPIPSDLALELSTRRLLLEGARIFPDTSRLERALGRHDRRLRAAERPPVDPSRLSLSPVEKGVLADARAGRMLGEALSGAQRPLRVRAVYALLVAGIVEDAHGAEFVGQGIEDDSGLFRLALPASAKPAAPSDRGQAGVSPRQELLRAYEALPRSSHYELLGVAPDASPARIAAAYRRMTDAQERDWRDLKNDLQLSSVLTALRLKRREAFQVLVDPERRAAYDRSLGALKPPHDGPVTPEDRARAARLSGEARALLQQGERDKAIALLIEATEADPRDKAVRAQLALLLSQHPKLARTAERHFLEVLELDPGDVEMRLQLARYYKRAGLHNRAIAQLKAVLGLEPGHGEAQRQLRALERTREAP